MCLVCILYSSLNRASSVGVKQLWTWEGAAFLASEQPGHSRISPLALHGPCRTPATFRITFQASLSLAVFLQPLTPINFRSFSPSAKRLSLSLCLLANGCFPFWGIHRTHSSQFLLLALFPHVAATVIFLSPSPSPNNSVNSWLQQNLHIPFSLTRPNIFPSIFQDSVPQYFYFAWPPVKTPYNLVKRS